AARQQGAKEKCGQPGKPKNTHGNDHSTNPPHGDKIVLRRLDPNGASAALLGSGEKRQRAGCVLAHAAYRSSARAGPSPNHWYPLRRSAEISLTSVWIDLSRSPKIGRLVPIS